MEHNQPHILQPSRKKLVWQDAATGGLYLGATLIAIMVISYLGRAMQVMQWLPGVLNFLALVLFMLFYTRKVSHYYRETGFYYPQSLGFILKMMLFAGVLAGIGQFVLQNHIDPAYYGAIIEQTLRESGFQEQQIDLAFETRVMQNPVVMALSGAVSLLLYGGMIGVVVSAFVKRPPMPPAPPASREASGPDKSDTKPNI